MNLHFVISAALTVLCTAGLNGADAKAPETRTSGTKLLDAYNKIEAGLLIANAAGETELVQQIAMTAAKSDPKLVVTVEKLSREDAIKSFTSGKAGLLLLRREPSAQEQQALSGAIMAPYAAEPTLIVVNAFNNLSEIKTEMLKKIFSGEVASWKPLGVSDYMIHLFGTEKNSPGTGPLNDKVLNGGKLTSKIFNVSTSPEVLQLVSTNNHALGFCGFVDTVPETVKLLKVDGVPPAESNILTGRYPLVNTYYVCYKSGNEIARLFAETLRSSEIGVILKSHGLIPKTEK
jgi:phosphate transport system substrate-binding protein